MQDGPTGGIPSLFSAVTCNCANLCGDPPSISRDSENACCQNSTTAIYYRHREHCSHNHKRAFQKRKNHWGWWIAFKYVSDLKKKVRKSLCTAYFECKGLFFYMWVIFKYLSILISNIIPQWSKNRLCTISILLTIKFLHLVLCPWICSGVF